MKISSQKKNLGGRVFLCLLFFWGTYQVVFAIDKKETSSLSHYIMAVMYDRLGNIEKAVSEYKKAIAGDYENPAIHLNLAASYIKSTKFPDAISELSLAVKFEPEAVEPHALLALLYTLQNKLDSATQEYEFALKNASKLAPQNIDIYKSLGLVYLQQKKLAQAKEVYELILGLTPRDAEAHFYLANIFYELKDNAKGEAELKKALELKPDFAEALNYLGYEYVEENRQLNRAETMIKKALKLEPDNGAYVDSLGWLYFKKGKFKEALKQLERAASLLEDPVIYNHLGDVYFKLGNTVSARKNWEKSLTLDSKQTNVTEKLRQIAQ